MLTNQVYIIACSLLPFFVSILSFFFIFVAFFQFSFKFMSESALHNYDHVVSELF